MIIYKYDPITKEYKGESEADIDPVATKIQGKEVYMTPVYATTEKPPKTNNFETTIFENTWKKIADYRGEYIVNSEMEPCVYQDLGNLPDGYIRITEAEADKIEEDNAYYIIKNNALIVNPNYNKIIREREQERIGNLSMTRGDVFEAIILAKGKTKTELRAMIENYPGLSDLERALYLNRFDEALDFYRKHPAINLIGGLLDITPEQMNRFFETKDYHELMN